MTKKGALRELALFAGAGGGILGGLLLGWRTICAVEVDPYARSVLLARQRDGILGPFPIWDDIRTFDGHPWRGHVDIVTGGFPCQDISLAGRGGGLGGKRSGLWFEMSRVIREVRPSHVFVENSPALASRGLGVVLGDLAEMGFDAEWGVLGARQAGAPHRRDRIWIVSTHPDRQQLRDIGRRGGGEGGEGEAQPGDNGSQGDVADTDREGQPQSQGGLTEERRRPGDGGWWSVEPDVGRVAHGVASRVDRLRVLGNGQVPAVAALAYRLLTPASKV